MAGSSLDRLLEAEEAAKRRIGSAKVHAKQLLDQARSEAAENREKARSGFKTKRARAIEEANSNASAEAERIRRDGIELAHGLSSRVRERIPIAADAVMETYLG